MIFCFEPRDLQIESNQWILFLKQRKILSRQEKNTKPCNKQQLCFPSNLVFQKPIYQGNQAGSTGCNVFFLDSVVDLSEAPGEVPPIVLAQDHLTVLQPALHTLANASPPKRQWTAIAALRNWPMNGYQLLQQKSVWTLDPIFGDVFLHGQPSFVIFVSGTPGTAGKEQPPSKLIQGTPSIQNFAHLFIREACLIGLPCSQVPMDKSLLEPSSFDARKPHLQLSDL